MFHGTDPSAILIFVFYHGAFLMLSTAPFLSEGLSVRRFSRTLLYIVSVCHILTSNCYRWQPGQDVHVLQPGAEQQVNNQVFRILQMFDEAGEPGDLSAGIEYGWL